MNSKHFQSGFERMIGIVAIPVFLIATVLVMIEEQSWEALIEVVAPAIVVVYVIFANLQRRTPTQWLLKVTAGGFFAVHALGAFLVWGADFPGAISRLIAGTGFVFAMVLDPIDRELASDPELGESHMPLAKESTASS